MSAVVEPIPFEDRLEKIVARAQRDHRLYSAQWELTYRCNELCTHCYLDVLPPGMKVPGELTTVECFGIIDQLADEGALQLTLSGGEILVRKDFFQIAEYARKKGFALRLFTNGILIKPESADRIAALHPLAVEISIYGAKPETHDAITQIARSHELTLRAVRLLRERKVPVELKCPLMHENYSELKAMEDLAEELGATFKYDITITPQDGGGTGPLKHRMSDEELVEHFRDNLDVDYWRNRAKANLDATHRFCGIGMSGLVIDPSGEVFPCIQTRKSAGNLRDKSLREIWRESSLWTELNTLTLQNLTVCNTCDLQNFCTRCHGVALVQDGDLKGCSSISFREATLRRQVLKERGLFDMEQPTGIVDQQAVGRKPYEKPRIVHRQPLEAQAVVCKTAKQTNGKGKGSCTIAFS